MFDNYDWENQRTNMVKEQLVIRGISDDAILQAFREVPRHRFIPEKYKEYAYADRPLPIGENQTISQPYIVAEMIEALEVTQNDSVLEVGIGSGFAAAVLSKVVENVYGVEIHQELVDQSRDKFKELNYHNINIRQGDGTRGWEEKAPFDGILVSAAAPEIPGPLLEQLKEGGFLIIPLGDSHIQSLTRIKKEEDEFIHENLEMVRFVPLVKEEGWN